MRIVVTGSSGFIGRNLTQHLRESGHTDIVEVGRETKPETLRSALAEADFVFHLAGVNRPRDIAEFETGNVGVTTVLCEALSARGRRIPVAYASSTQASLDNPYGRSKRFAEDRLRRHAQDTGSPVFVARLPNVFGKWSRPNYNSAVATFCHNVAHDLPITINDAAAPLCLVYIDDAVRAFGELLGRVDDGFTPVDVGPVYATTVGEVAGIVESFRRVRETLLIPRVGTGLVRALYATYVSALPTSAFAYPLQQHADPRGVFVEMLKTPDSGQFSYFTAHPGITRGEHYHHTKTEKFLVVRGKARFRFRHLLTNEQHEVSVTGDMPQIVESVPGWAHDIMNTGDEEMIVMLWANEIFDRQRPDTFAMKTTP